MSPKPASPKRRREDLRSIMLVNGFEDDIRQCPVVGAYEETGWMQCPMSNRWAKPNECSFSYNYVYREPPRVQCYRNFYAEESEVPYAHQQRDSVAYNRYVPPQPIVPNLPCHQGQQWNYNTMCFNVDGQPCQYTSVVDLEDFMNNEKRKEKSRVAARCRRTKEMQIFAELTAALPAKKEEVEQLDKASVMRLAISYLRARDVVSMLPETDAKEPEPKPPEGLEEISSEVSYMKALDGFVLVLSQQGDIVYCSENIAEHLGVNQVEIMGQSVFEFSHPCDHDEIRENLRPNNSGGRRELLLRLKCTLTNKGRNVHLKSASYKVIRVTGHMLAADATENNNKVDENDKRDGDEKKMFKNGSLIAVGRPIPHPSNIEVPLDTKTFLTKHSLDMKFTHTDDALMKILGYEPNELVGSSLYEYHHASDSSALIHQFKSLFSKGQCETGQYRFLGKTGGYAWVQTQATVITDKQQKPISVVCVNYVISGVECKDEVFAAHQVRHTEVKPVVAPPVAPLAPAPSRKSAPTIGLPIPNGTIVGPVIPKDEQPIPVTELIFTQIGDKEMNKGFYMYSKDEGLTMLKEEADELVNLAPNAGDACISLDNSSFNMFDDFIFSDSYNDNYCSLLGDDLANGSPVDSLTDSLLLSSPEPQESDSSCELITELSFDGVKSENEAEDGNYIPASDDLPVLESAVMWGALPDSVSLARPQPTETQSTSSAPALQRLLVAPPTGPPPQDLITNIYSDPGLISNRTVSWDTGVKRLMKQDEEPNAKRAKRSPSPAKTTPTSSPSSSVLMNLLDIQQSSQQILQQKPPSMQVNYTMVINEQKNMSNQVNRNVQIPVIKVQNIQNKQLPHNNVAVVNPVVRKTIISNPMSPLTLNVCSPIYSLPSSPNTSNYTSPAMSPAQRDRLLSPYSTPQMLSPVDKFSQYGLGNNLMSPNAGLIQGRDPYLNKMQASPNFPIQPVDALLDSNMSTDMWSSDILQETGDILTALDDVKLV